MEDGPIDWQEFEKRFGRSTHRIGRLFINDSTEKLAALRDCIEGQDLVGIEEAAHYLKNAAGPIGAKLAFEAADDLESAAGAEDSVEALKTRLASVERAFRDAFEELRQQIG